MNRINQKIDCPCGSGALVTVCCQPLLDGKGEAKTAEQLMRSRYSAYVLLDRDYLLRTWHPKHRPHTLALDSQQGWLGLKILRVEEGQAHHGAGIVEFVARYKMNGRAHRLHEVSRFEKSNGTWKYLHSI